MGVPRLVDVVRYLDAVPDPRRSNKTYTLPQLLTITLLAVLCRCDEGRRLDLATDKQSTQRRYYLTSLDPRRVGAGRLLELTRATGARRTSCTGAWP